MAEKMVDWRVVKMAESRGLTRVVMTAAMRVQKMVAKTEVTKAVMSVEKWVVLMVAKMEAMKAAMKASLMVVTSDDEKVRLKVGLLVGSTESMTVALMAHK